MSFRDQRPEADRRVKRACWSYSQLSQFLRCPLRFYFERVAKLPRAFTPSGMALGSAVHQGLAAYHHGLQAGVSADSEQVQAAFLDAWMDEEQQRPIQFRDGETRNGMIDQGVALLEAYVKESPPTNILAVEEPMMVPLATSGGAVLEKPLLAVVDLLCQGEDELIVSEFKTSGRRLSESEAGCALQATCYAHAVRERYEQPARVRYTVLVKTKTPQVQYLDTSRTEADMSRLGDIAQAVEKAIESEAFYPVETPLNCSGCAFRHPCRAWQGNSSRPANSQNGFAEELAAC